MKKVSSNLCHKTIKKIKKVINLCKDLKKTAVILLDDYLGYFIYTLLLYWLIYVLLKNTLPKNSPHHAEILFWESILHLSSWPYYLLTSFIISIPIAHWGFNYKEYHKVNRLFKGTELYEKLWHASSQYGSVVPLLSHIKQYSLDSKVRQTLQEFCSTSTEEAFLKWHPQQYSHISRNVINECLDLQLKLKIQSSRTKELLHDLSKKVPTEVAKEILLFSGASLTFLKKNYPLSLKEYTIELDHAENFNEARVTNEVKKYR